MGGIAKGLLRGSDGEPLVVRTARLLEHLGHDPVLVGAHEAYSGLPWPRLDDDPSAVGPLAGLVALLEHARSETNVLAFACDMPAISQDLVRALESAPPARAVAPRHRFWEPFAARYDVAIVDVARQLAAAGGSFQSLLERVGAVALAWNDDGALVDWDVPADLNGARRGPQARR
jgi:molybdopterin-guanine dinucleotide biosynthesis protein A